MSFTSYILQDWKANQDTSFKSRLALLLFRSSRALQNLPPFFWIIALFVRFFYQIFVEWILGIEIPWDTQIDPGLKLQHGHGLVINHHTIIGKDCIVRNSTTIGNKKFADGTYSNCPEIGDRVDIGANVVIIGAIYIGDNAIIGAGSVVVKDVPANAVVVGNPAHVIRMQEPIDSSIMARAL